MKKNLDSTISIFYDFQGYSFVLLSREGGECHALHLRGFLNIRKAIVFCPGVEFWYALNFDFKQRNGPIAEGGRQKIRYFWLFENSAWKYLYAVTRRRARNWAGGWGSGGAFHDRFNPFPPVPLLITKNLEKMFLVEKNCKITQ